MRFKANFQYKPSSFQLDDCQIEKIVELSREEFCKLRITPLVDQPFIAKHKGCMFSEDGVLHCLLALDKDGSDGVLIESEGYNYPRYAAYVPGMREIVNAQMERAVDFIIQEGTEETSSGNWKISFEHLEDRLGLTIHEDSGLDALLVDAMYRREEVMEAEIYEGCIDATYYTSFCRGLNGGMDSVVYLPEQRKAELFDQAVAAVLERHKGQELYDMLHNNFGMTIQEIYAQGYLTDTELTDASAVPKQVLDSGMRLRDVLQHMDIPDGTYLTSNSFDHQLALKDLTKLTPTDLESSPLMDAQVIDIRESCWGVSLFLDETGSLELSRFWSSLHLVQNMEQTMGPTMG